MRRFFFNPEERTGDLVVLSGTESHHIRTVLRLRPGMQVELFDGSGGIHQAELVAIGDKILTRIVSSSHEQTGPVIPLRVSQGMLKGKNMDTVVQKCTELGVDGLIPMMTARCQGRPDLARDRKKHERWRRIVEEACKQCGRSRPMQLLDTLDFQDVAERQGPGTEGLKILFWDEERDVHIHDLLPFHDVGTIHILLGPEGGFTGAEVAMARSAGWRTVSLGRRILRAETATLASVAILQHLLGAM